MYQKTWSGDWRARILERTKQHGFDSVTQFAGARMGASLFELADELGSEDVAGVQVMWMLIDEARRANILPRALGDLLARWLRQALPHGWNCPLDEESKSEVAGALASWETELQDYLDEERVFQAGQALLSAELPAGWLPAGPDDPVIVAFVDRCLGRGPS